MSGHATKAEPERLRAMREEWDARAREKARYYIATDVGDTAEEFFGSGRADYEANARAFLERHGFCPKGKTALEIGCGIGRMTQAFAGEFGEVIGVDVSPEMVQQARAEAPANARFVCGSGADLGEIRDSSVDFAFSFIVFQHIPDRRITLGYFEEIGRVLRPGGMFRVHVNGLPYVRLAGSVWEGYVSHSPRLKRIGVRAVPFVRRRRLGTWQGHPVNLGEVRRTCEQAGLEIVEVIGRWTANMWVGGRKRR
jgi:ubiquinone/menaquinone biosynthesis C-methylase UbiE